MDVYGERGESMIDYMVGDWRIRKGLERIGIAEKMDSDYHLITAWIRGRGVEVGKGGTKHKGKGRGSRVWTEKGKEVIKKVLREKPEREDRGGMERDKRGGKGGVKKRWEGGVHGLGGG